jgi:curved DNA-binding protein CbpA
MSIPTLYEILQVSNSATQAEIKKQYKQLSKIHHPDKGGSPEIFEIITKAYTVLVDEQKRQDYDSKLMPQTNHFKLKRQHDTFVKIVNNSGYENKDAFPKQIHDVAISVDDVKTQLYNLSTSREQDDIEFENNQTNKNANSENETESDCDSKTGQLIIAQNQLTQANNNYSDLNSYGKLYAENDDFDGNLQFTNINHSNGIKAKKQQQINNNITSSYEQELKNRQHEIEVIESNKKSNEKKIFKLFEMELQMRQQNNNT